MACTDASPRIAVEIFVEQREAAPVRIAGISRVISVAGASSGSVGQERFRKAAAQLSRHLKEIHVLTRSRGALDAYFVTVEMVIPFQSLDDEIVHRKPDRPAPIGIAAKQAGCGLARRVIHTMLLTIGLQHEGVIAMKARQRPYAVRR